MSKEVRLKYTDTGMPQWSYWEAEPLGEEGEYDVKPTWTRQGQFYDRTYSFESSSACCRDMFGLFAVIETAK